MVQDSSQLIGDEMKDKNTRVGSWIKEILNSWKSKGSIGNAHPKSASKARQMAIAIAFDKVKRGKK